MPKKNDNIIGQSEGPILNGGHQTPQQAEIVKQEGGGLTDRERRHTLEGPSRRDDPAIGGSSNGHSDQIAANGPEEGRKVAGGLYETEQTQGQGVSENKPRHRPT
ncbi:hypothetical protein [Microvirga pudoricolor]|uniref:hypothetical protein n=1 Tax=Microvirga pudoricolor TaxID=2778729 RepID=UPI00194FEDAF|nr:hypothetical protein [Microvirga pudoricolor]MBM6594099.1 hypothetical protein [Microvirga pudoricolor]